MSDLLPEDNCNRCGGLLYDDNIAHTELMLSTCYACGESTDSQIILNRLYPDYTPPKRTFLPGTPLHRNVINRVLDERDDELDYYGSIADIADEIDVHLQRRRKS